MKRMHARLLPAVWVLACAGVLAACSERASSPPAKAAGHTAWLAMARGQVDVEGGLIHIVAPSDGLVDAVEAEDGDEVKQGQVLAVLDQRAAQIGLGIAEAHLSQAEAQVGVAKARVPEALLQAQRLGEAAEAGAATGQSAGEAGATLALLKAQVTAADATVKVARQEVEQARAQLDARVIKAPFAGRIVRRTVHVGDAVSVQAQSELFQLLPDRPRIVRAELDESYVDLIKPGMRAEVVRDSDEGRAVQARVLRVGELFGPSRLADDPVERAGAHDVECVLQLEESSFRIGQRVLVRFMPDR